jgi:3-oxoacyl-[acyl-carrier protein] reductase
MSARPCLVVGASGNIGEAIAHRLMKEGRPVALTRSGRSDPPASLADIGDKGRWYAVDVRNSAAVRETVAQVEKDFAAAPDLVYCAGIVRDKAILLMSDEDWDDVIATNLSGAFYFMRALTRALMMTGNGRMVLIGSITALIGNPGQLNYAATKGGLESMARVAAVELGRYGITCNVVAPGTVEGRMLGQLPAKALENFKKGIPAKRFAQPDEVAGLVSYLVSEESQYLTGQTIYFDGGLSVC